MRREDGRKARKWYADDTEYAIVEATARDHERPTAEYVRACVLADAKRYVRRSPGILDTIRAIAREEAESVQAGRDAIRRPTTSLGAADALAGQPARAESRQTGGVA